MELVALIFIALLITLMARIIYLKRTPAPPQIIVITNIRQLRQRIRNYDTKILPFKRKDTK